ncbi:hypothetical protein [Trichlorobacter ammonificans]|uniref:V-type ATP synthase subunit C n=1 Tax=Trichlorobacter ammonificans TaxID=2916410 RepID=A0ABM9DA85_9BACT|nr:hypothetical protein [Trichlorobacter ammonificans]CAH2032128.1 conserved protein of unknown function [Trichlorobacter ammonificans]
MRRLLCDLPAGQSADCLLARIRGRRSFLVRDWQHLQTPRQPTASLPAAPWRPLPSAEPHWALQALRREYRWVFARMTEPLRRATAPFFWLAELKPLAVCLRLLAGGQPLPESLLAASLLAAPLRELLRSGGGCAGAVERLERRLVDCHPAFGGLGAAFRAAGTGGTERLLWERSLEAACSGPLHPQMRCCLTLVVDSRNLSALLNGLRWRQTEPSRLLAGGTLDPARLIELFRRNDNAGLLRLAARLGGMDGAGQEVDPEQLLRIARRRLTARLVRTGDGVGLILDYLWRCSDEAAMIGLLEKLEAIGPEQVAAELRR